MRMIRRVYSSLAQSVEHLTVNQGVAGSSPAGGAKKEKQTDWSAFLFIQSEGLVCNHRAKCGVWNSSRCDGMASRDSV